MMNKLLIKTSLLVVTTVSCILNVCISSQLSLVLSATFAGDKLLKRVRISLLSIWETDSAVAQHRGNNSTRVRVTVQQVDIMTALRGEGPIISTPSTFHGRLIVVRCKVRLSVSIKLTALFDFQTKFGLTISGHYDQLKKHLKTFFFQRIFKSRFSFCLKLVVCI